MAPKFANVLRFDVTRWLVDTRQAAKYRLLVPIANFLRFHVTRWLIHTRQAAKYHLLPRSPKQPLFVLAEPRTGSWLICDYLCSVPGISICGEILNPQEPCALPRQGVSKSAALRHIARSLNSCPSAIAGTKLMLCQMKSYGLTVDDLHHSFPNALYLIVYRKSLVEQFASVEVANTTGRWMMHDPNSHRFNATIRVAPDDFLKFCESQRDFYRNLFNRTWLSSCARVVSYEDLAERAQEIFDDALFPFLSLVPTRVTTKLTKQNRRSMRDLIENFEEIQDLLTVHGMQTYAFDAVSEVLPESGLGISTAV
jgi:hypothetical protein